MHPIWLLLVLAVVVPLAGQVYRRRNGQRRELLQLARVNGLTFSSLDLIGLHERYDNLELIRRGHNRHARNVLCGSVDAGLVAVFRYSYDVGFGVEQSSRQSWMAVLESTRPLAAWRAGPAQNLRTEPAGEAARVGPFMVRADHAASLERLRDLGVWSALMEMPENWEFESQGTLLAIAAPCDDTSGVAEQLLNSVGRLSSHLLMTGQGR